MQFIRDKGFIIKRVNFGDSDRYVTIFTKDHGKIEVVARGIRKMRSKRVSFVEPLNLIDFQAIKTSKNHILTEVKLLDTYSELKSDLSHMRKVFLTCELIESLLPLGQRNEDIFDLMERAMSKLVDNERNVVYFQAKLLSLLGYWDGKTSFKNEDHVRQYTEQIIERKLKTGTVFDY